MLKALKEFNNGVVSWDLFFKFWEEQQDIYSKIKYLDSSVYDLTDENDRHVAFGMIGDEIKKAWESLSKFEEKADRERDEAGGRHVEVFDRGTKAGIEVLGIFLKHRQGLEQTMEEYQKKWSILHYDKLKEAVSEAIANKPEDPENKILPEKADYPRTHAVQGESGRMAVRDAADDVIRTALHLKDVHDILKDAEAVHEYDTRKRFAEHILKDEIQELQRIAASLTEASGEESTKDGHAEVYLKFDN